jgi:hypothetical protein
VKRRQEEEGMTAAKKRKSDSKRKSSTKAKNVVAQMLPGGLLPHPGGMFLFYVTIYKFCT